ncbi:phosphoribosylanthranilate isomerase [Nocardioides dubius]|uniref:N-(5'-phosphoribosyl)anthranilate isomerase n=1 Tax=Nocardioides dubius TaxID=317019 RepID=A0ABN1TRD7_9ACTN
MYLKICGLRTAEHIEVALASGADAIGFVMNRTSSRRVDVDQARRLVAVVAGRADTVLVVNDMPADEAARIAQQVGIDVVQLHGPRYDAAAFADALAIVPRVWRATSLADDPDLSVGAFGEEVLLLDAPKPGSGETWDLSALVERAPAGKWLLAGGLNPDNVAEAIATAKPWGVDVSSGVESAPGEKDSFRIAAFAAAARDA